MALYNRCDPPMGGGQFFKQKKGNCLFPKRFDMYS